MVISIYNLASLFNVAICSSGFNISTSPSFCISLAVTTQGPIASIITVFGPGQCKFATKLFKFNTNSVTSSFTPGTVENSCITPSILTLVTATPGKDESSTLLKLFPNVFPKPLSSGSTVNFPYFLSSDNSATSILGFSISINYDPP